MQYMISYSGKVWWKKIWQINRSSNRLLIVITGFSLANYGRFAKFTKLSPCQIFPVYSIWLYYSSAFGQEANGPSSVCEGNNVTLQCRVVFNDFPRDSVWYRNGTSIRVGANDFIPNHNQILNSTTGVFTDLVITNVTMEDDNTVYTCSSSDDSITSSVVLNVSGKYVHFNDYLFVVKGLTVISENSL